MSSHLPNAGAISSLCELCELTPDQVVAALSGTIPHLLTRRKLVNGTGEVKEATLDRLAEFFNARLPLKLKGADLVNPPPLLLALARGMGQAPFTVYPTSEKAFLDFQAKLANGTIDVQDKEVMVVSYSLDHFGPNVVQPLLEKCAKVRVYLPSESVARDSGSKVQCDLIGDTLAKYKEHDAYARHDLVFVRVAVPLTFEGFFVPEVAACAAWYIWVPTLHTSDKCEDQERGLLRDLYSDLADNKRPTTHGRRSFCRAGDPVALVGNRMPHVLTYFRPGEENAEFQSLARMFRALCGALDRDPASERLSEFPRPLPTAPQPQ